MTLFRTRNKYYGRGICPVAVLYVALNVLSSAHLRSARRHYLVVPRHSLSSNKCLAFAVAGPTVWNSLSDDLPTLSTEFQSDVCLKLELVSEY